LPSLFQYNQDLDSDSDEDAGKIDVPYRVWLVVASIATILAIWNPKHYELLAKIAWSITGPGFTFSQIWNEPHDLLSSAVFAVFVLVHYGLMQALYPYLPVGHYGYILLIAIAEIMTIGLAYQVWLHLRSDKGEPSSEE
jgi:hypothetical protein